MTDLKQRVLEAAKAIGLFRLSRWLTRNRLRILCYHGVWLDDALPNPFNFLYMRPERFAARMDFLKRERYPVLPLDEALDRLEANTLPPAPVVITIDDGWYGTYSRMVPILSKYGFPATIYLTTYHAETQTAVFGVALQHILLTAPLRTLDCAALDLPLGAHTAFELGDPVQRTKAHEEISAFAETALTAMQREALLERIANGLGYDWDKARSSCQFGLMSIDEAAQCAVQGVDFQLHTHRHRVTHDERICIDGELADNRTRLERVSAKTATHFCYPSGRWHADHFPHLANAGVRSATTTDNGFCKRGTHMLALPRVLDGDKVTDIEFEAELCGLLELQRRCLAWLRPRA